MSTQATELTTAEFTEYEARRLTDEIRRDGTALWEKASTAYEGRIWLALGYEAGQVGWSEYLATEFPDGLVIPPKNRQNDAIQRYIDAGMSTRAIATVTDLSQQTVVRRVQAIREAIGDSDESPGGVQGIDGKQYAQARPQRKEVEAEIVYDDEPEPQNGAPYSTGSSAQPAPSPLVEPARAEALNRPASDLGLKPFEVAEQHGPSHHLVTAEMVQESLAELIHSPPRGFPSAKNYASEIEHILALGAWTPEGKEAIENSIGEVADQVADTTRMLTRLLIELAEDRHAEGKAVAALATPQVANAVTEAMRNLRRVSEISTNN